MHRAHDQFGRRFYQGTATGGIAKRGGQEQRAQEWLHLVVVAAKQAGQTFHFVGVGREGDELPPQLLDDRLRGPWMTQQDCQDVIAREMPRLPKESLLATVVELHAVDELTAIAIERPAGKSAGRILDIGFAVVPLTQRKELEQLA